MPTAILLSTVVLLLSCGASVSAQALRGIFVQSNHIFRRFALKDVKTEPKRIDELKRDQFGNSFPYVLDVVLRYVYAGMQGDAWRFFDRHYSGQNVRAMKLKIKHRLRGDGVYRFLYSAPRKG